MIAILAALAMGILFAAGLIISGMTDPANIKGFLDVFGAWRPQLLAVLGTGVVATWAVYALAKRRTRPLADLGFYWPAATQIDPPLVLGSALFGAGWALAGYCPGPALVAAGALRPEAIVFVLAMFAGGGVHRAWKK